MNDLHLASTEFFSRREHATEGNYYSMKNRVRFGFDSPPSGGPAPHLGEDGDFIKAAAELNIKCKML